MRLVKIAMVLVGVSLVSWGMSPSQGSEDVSEDKMKLAREVVELQRTRDFFMAQWESEKRAMLENVPAENRNAQMKTWMNVMRDHVVDGQTEEWVRALASELNKANLQSAARFLRQPDYQKWVADQLEAHPVFLENMRSRQEAATSVMADEIGNFDKRKRRIAEVEPVGDSRLGAALGMTPGAQLDAHLNNPYSKMIQVPVANGSIADIVPDMSVELFPAADGARVVSLRGTRAYADQSACEAAQGRLTGELRVYFPETDVTDCGTKRFLDADREVRMHATCREQDIGDAMILSLQITHVPTQNAAYGAMESDEVHAKAGGNQDGD